VTDGSNPPLSKTGTVTLIIDPAPLALAFSTLPNGTVGQPYFATILTTGGTAPFACTTTAGTLPAGLTQNNCTISGTPTTAGTLTITEQVTDASNPQQSVSGSLSVTITAPGNLTLTLASLPNGTVGVPYDSTIGVTGGTAPYACVVL